MIKQTTTFEPDLVVTFKVTLPCPSYMYPMGQSVIRKEDYVVIFKPTIKPNMFGYKSTSQSLTKGDFKCAVTKYYNFCKAHQGPIHKTITRTG